MNTIKPTKSIKQNHVDLVVVVVYIYGYSKESQKGDATDRNCMHVCSNVIDVASICIYRDST